MNSRKLALLISLCLTDQSAWAVTKTWDDGVDDFGVLRGDGISWGDKFNWNLDGVPAGVDDVVLNTSLVKVQNGNVAFAATLDAGTTDIDINGSLTVFGTFENNVTVTVVAADDSPSSGASFKVGEGSTLEGDGEVFLQRTFELGVAPASFGSSGTIPVTHGPNHTIRGEGDITVNLINNGLIIAEDRDSNPAAVLHIIGSLQNNNIVRSSATAQIHVSGDLTQSAAGRLIADSNTVRLNQTTITDGTLEGTGGGEFESGNAGLTLDGVHLTANLTKFAETTAADLIIANNTFTNDATITMGKDANEAAFFDFATSETVAGTGEIILLTENLSGNGSRMRSFNGAIGTLSTGQTVRGVGVISAGIINNGTIIAEPRNGTTLALTSNPDPKTNNNIIRADAGATLRISDTIVSQDNTNGQILANGGTVEFALGGTISGGRLEATAGGVFQTNSTGRIENVVNNAPFNILNADSLSVDGSSLTNNNTITVNSTGASGITRLIVVDNVTVDGTGEIVLPEVALQSQLVVNEGFTLTNSANHTIRGKGRIIGDGTVVNNGRMEGNSAAEPLEIRSTRLMGTGVLKDVEIGFVATHAPGVSTAIVPLEGSYQTSSTSTLEIEIGGLTPGTEHDQLSSTGMVNLGGGSALDVEFIDLANGYLPAAGHRFDIITSSVNSITGTFNNNEVTLPEFGFGRAITWAPIDYSNPLKVTLEIAAVDFLDADFDEDGDVDGDDLTRWQTNYGTGNSHMQGDADGDDDVDGSDFLRWQRQFGLGISPLRAVSSSTTVVPEPNTFVLGLIFLVYSLRFSPSMTRK